MPQCCFKLLNDSLSTGLRFRFIGQTNQGPAYIISINSCLSVPHLYFTAMSSYLLENTEVLLHILDFAYVFFFSSLLKIPPSGCTSGERCVRLQVSDQPLHLKPSHVLPGKSFYCFLCAIPYVVTAFSTFPKKRKKPSLLCLQSSLCND